MLSQGTQYWIIRGAGAVGAGYGYGALFGALGEPLRSFGLPDLTLVLWIAGGLTSSAALWLANARARRLALEALVLFVLPCWGFVINAGLESCAVPCEVAYPLLATPEAYGIAGLYGVGALAYCVSRARPERLRPVTEVFVLGTMIAGMALMLPVAVQFDGLVLLGLIIAPMGLPLISPHLVLVLFALELRRRSRSHAEALTPEARGPIAQHRLFGRALVVAPSLLGLYAAAAALWYRDPAGVARAFTRTCAGTFAQLTAGEGADCHYLCTVAARGHARWVRPERLGWRRGQLILVTRQLAVANAFEDLLAERVPRIARAASAL